ncbi:unnamed protein product [Diatraea saccharalis]|uniref:Uncharacterized protein n=1 Tax=Diatraea saccharalis TaxID=40085 RepID=A0A9N9QYV2_9NEOP|nr:unnamed protein product [Diatraea saccharalis]
MSNPRCEQHPLLYEELSEEEQLSPRLKARQRSMVYRGYSKNKIRGAAAIFKLWPDHWSSSLAYWWIGLGMIALVTLIIYNSVSVFALLPSEHFKEITTRLRNNEKDTTIAKENQEPLNVFMHFFVEQNNEIDLSSYTPYIETIANKYSDYYYKILIITNDTNVEANIISAEENNENALNLLWTKKPVPQSVKNNINIQHITLSKYMENTPLRKHWRHLPYQFIEFLTRAVSIWDKGGIAFDPVILTPLSPHAVYIEKLQNILRDYHHIPKKCSKNIKSIKKSHDSPKKKVNNIRDIIDALEKESDGWSSTEQSLEEAENKKEIVITNSFQGTLKQLNENKRKNEILKDSDTNVVSTTQIHPTINKIPNIKEEVKFSSPSHDQHIIQTSLTNDSNSFALLPMFLDFLFKNKPSSEIVYSHKEEPFTKSRKRKHVLPLNEKKNKTSQNNNKSDNLNPEIVSANFTNDYSNQHTVETNQINITSPFTIDLNGKLIASVIPCHAFLGTIFSDLAHNQESLTNFIINELSIFCKGVLSSCNGIDVILL